MEGGLGKGEEEGGLEGRRRRGERGEGTKGKVCALNGRAENE